MVEFYGESFSSRLMLGSALYPSPDIFQRSVRRQVPRSSRCRCAARARGSGPASISGTWCNRSGVRVLPNTAGCRTPKEAIATAMMARELFETPWIKLEVIANDDTLQPDLFGLVEAAASLTREGFKVFPYTTEDLSAAEKLLGAGCEVLMPWGCADRLGAGV